MSEFNYEGIKSGLKRTDILNRMKDTLSDFRYNHCLRVEKTSRALAAEFGGDVDRAGLAGLLHDYAKERSDEEFITEINKKTFRPRVVTC